MAPDGHCLFSSLLHQLCHHEPDGSSHLTAVRALRQEVVSHIYAHLDAYWLSLLDTTNSLDLPEEEQFVRVDRFLSLLRDDCEWGGEETILAVSRLYKCNVLIYNEGGTRHIHDAPTPSSLTLHIAYRLASSHTRTNYDSVLNVTTLSALSDPSTISVSTFLEHHMPSNPTNAASAVHYSPPESHLAAWQQQQIVNASQISCQSSTSSPPITPLDLSTKVFVGSWNVRGCSSPEDQEMLDQYFSAQKYLIVALQETRMIGCTIDTPHYVWMNVNNDDTLQARVGGGTALLVHKTVYNRDGFRRVSANTCSYLCQIF